ncbi:MAG: Uma2 family endonuclease, partial [Oscillatoriales cyanobacterium]
YDPDRHDLSILGRSERGDLHLIGDRAHDWVSPRLGIRFQMDADTLTLFRPDGQPFSTLTEEIQRTAQERQRAEEANQRAEQERERADRLADKLRELGIDPEAIE